MELKQRTKRLIELWDSHAERRRVNGDLFEMFGGNVGNIMGKWIDSHIISPRARTQMKANLAPLNIVDKLVDKKSAAYDYGVSRTADASYAALLEDYLQNTETDDVVKSAWELLNLHGDSLIQFFVADGYVQSRAIPSQLFIVWSDDPQYPTRPDGVLMWFGREKNGASEVDIFLAWTAEEVWAFDSEGRARVDLLGENVEGVNEWGVLPFVYLNSDPYRLMPPPDSDFLQMARLLPLKVTDLNYAAQYQAHSITVIKGDAPLSLDRNPDAIWVLPTSDTDEQTSIEILSPKVDFTGAKDLVLSQISLFLSLRGIRPGAVAGSAAESLASGISKLIDEGDATQLIIRQQQEAVQIERALWETIGAIHDASAGDMVNRGRFGDSVRDTLLVMFEKPEVIPDQGALTTVLKEQLDMGLITKKFALARLYPHMSEDVRDEMLQSIEEGVTNGRSTTGGDDSGA